MCRFISINRRRRVILEAIAEKMTADTVLFRRGAGMVLGITDQFVRSPELREACSLRA
jgi:hypothetical protein